MDQFRLFTHRGVSGDHVVDGGDRPLWSGADQRAAFVVAFDIFAVERERHVAALAGPRSRGRRHMLFRGRCHQLTITLQRLVVSRIDPFDFRLTVLDCVLRACNRLIEVFQLALQGRRHTSLFLFARFDFRLHF